MMITANFISSWRGIVSAHQMRDVSWPELSFTLQRHTALSKSLLSSSIWLLYPQIWPNFIIRICPILHRTALSTLRTYSHIVFINFPVCAHFLCSDWWFAAHFHWLDCASAPLVCVLVKHSDSTVPLNVSFTGTVWSTICCMKYCNMMNDFMSGEVWEVKSHIWTRWSYTLLAGSFYPL